jgi:AraC-like DNA-binding protein
MDMQTLAFWLCKLALTDTADMGSSARATVRFRQDQHPERGALLIAGYILERDYSAGCHRRVLEEFAIVYLLEGSGTYSDELNGARTVRQGDVIVLFPGLEHSYERGPGATWSESFIVFQGNLFHQLERDGLLKRDEPVLSPGLDSDLVATFAAIIRDYRQAVHGSDAHFAARIHMLLADIVAKHRRHSDAATHDKIALARAYLAEQLHRPLDVAQVARRLDMTYGTFRKFFSRTVGIAPARYRALLRIDEAKRLLIETRLSLAEIAERIGYCDRYFFARQFKQLAHQTPGEFRRSVN